MSQAGDLLGGIASTLWVLFALIVFVLLRPYIVRLLPNLKHLSVGATGVSMEFVERKLDEAVASTPDPEARAAFGEAAKRGVLARLERNADLVRRARVLWVDDHPENNAPIAELLRQLGARVDTPRTNDAAFSLLNSQRYEVIISDVRRDNEGPGSNLKGIELVEGVFQEFKQQVILFTLRFDPLTVPDITVEDRLKLVEVVRKGVFGVSYRYDQQLHLILDVIERELL